MNHTELDGQLVRKEMALDDYRRKSDYGKTPEYLAQRKQELGQHQQQKQMAEQHAAASAAASGYVMLPENERLDILAGLQKNLDKLNTDFAKLSLVIDTLPKINRYAPCEAEVCLILFIDSKLMLEREIKRIESDIKKFSHSNIVVRLD